MPGLAFIDAVPCLRATEFESVDRAVAGAGEARCTRLGVTHPGGCFFGSVDVVVSGLFPVGVARRRAYCAVD